MKGPNVIGVFSCKNSKLKLHETKTEIELEWISDLRGLTDRMRAQL